MEESEDEDKETQAKKFSPAEPVKKFLTQADLKPLKNDKRRWMMNHFPIPACDAAHPAKLDEAVACLIPRSAKSYDSYLSKLQRFTMDAMGPLVWLLHERQQGLEVDVDGAVEASLALLGNAAAHFNVERRRSLLKHLNKDLRPLAEAEFPERGPYLFGDDFGKRAKTMSDNVSALKGLHQKGKAPSQSHFSGSGDSNSRRFIPYKPQSCRHAWGNNQGVRIGGGRQGAYRSVFGRLDQTPRNQSKPPKSQKNASK